MALPQGTVDWGDDLAVPMNPIHGIWSFVPGQEVPLGGSPDMMNCVVRKAMLCKRPGYTQFPAAASSMGGRIVGLYSTQDKANVSYLYACTPVGLFEFTAGAWAAVSGPALTGTTERLFVWETSQNSVVFCQGVDNVMRVAFGGVYAVLNANCKPARYLTRFASRLFLAHTVETAAQQPFRVRRAVAGDHTDWTGIGAGFTDLDEFPYHIANLKKLHSQLAVYTEQSIIVGTRTEDPAAPVRFDPVVTDIGLYAPYTLQGRNERHYFVGNDDFYIFNGGQVESFGWQIRDHIFPVLNINKLHMNFAAITYDSQEYLAFLCTGSSDTPNRVWAYNWARQIHYPWSIDGPVCATRHRSEDPLTWNDLTVTWDSQSYEWDAQAIQEGFPSLMTGHTDGKVYKWGSNYLSDNGAAIPCWWQSKDFTAKDLGGDQSKQITLKHVLITYKETGSDANISIDYSVDGGSSWLPSENIVLPGGPGKVKVAAAHRQVTGNQVRFRFQNYSADQAFQIIEFIPVFDKPETIKSAGV